MLKQLQISNLGSKGLNTEVAPWTLPPEFLTFGDNFRIESNTVCPVRSFAVWQKDIGAEVNKLVYIYDADQPYWLLLTDRGMVSFDGTNNIDETPLVFNAITGVDNWSYAHLGKLIIVNHPQEGAYYLNGMGGGFQPLPWDTATAWPDVNESCKVMRSHKNFLFGLNLTSAGIQQTDSYRWSTAADNNGLPFTWDPDEPSGLAGRAALGGDGGDILDGRSLRNSFVIYSRKAIDVLDFIGGEFIWNRRELSNSIGVISTDCIVSIPGKHIFISDNDIYITDGTSLTSLLHDRIKSIFATRLNHNAIETSYCFSNDIEKEAWFCVPVDDSVYPNKAYIYNYADDTWSIRSLPEGNTFAAYGGIHEAAVSWDSLKLAWDIENTAWRGFQTTAEDNTIVLAAGSKLLMLATASTILNPEHESQLVHIERVTLPIVDNNVTCMVSAVYPHISGDVLVQIRIGVQDTIHGPIQWSEPANFQSGVNHKVNVRLSGRYISWQILSQEDEDWKMTGMDIEYEMAGRR